MLQYDVKAKYQFISRKFFGHEVFFNHPKATRVCIRSINQSNRFTSVRLLFLFSRVFALSTYRSKLRLHSHSTGQIFARLKNLTGHFVHTEPFSIFALFKTPKRTQFSTHPLPCERRLSSVESLIPNRNIA